MTNELQPYGNTQQIEAGEASFDENAEPLTLGEAARTLGIYEIPVQLEALVDQEFDILGARPFPSSFENQPDPYFTRVRLTKTLERMSVVIGAGVPREVIEKYIAAGVNRPLRVVLRFKAGAGNYSGYYFFEDPDGNEVK